MPAFLAVNGVCVAFAIFSIFDDPARATAFALIAIASALTGLLVELSIKPKGG